MPAKVMKKGECTYKQTNFIYFVAVGEQKYNVRRKCISSS